jgi:hypothetical protein
MAGSMKAVMGDLGPHLDTLETCVRGALADFMEHYATRRYLMTKRSEASLIHDLMLRRCDLAFGDLKENGGTHGVYKFGNRRLVLFLDGQIRVKPKKLTSKLRASNIPTQAVLQFIHQDPQTSFVPAPTNLHVGYVVGRNAEVTAAKVWITCPSGNDIAWERELTCAAEKPTPGATVHAVPSAAPPRRARVKPEVAAKRGKKSRKAGNGTDGS